MPAAPEAQVSPLWEWLSSGLCQAHGALAQEGLLVTVNGQGWTVGTIPCGE